MAPRLNERSSGSAKSTMSERFRRCGAAGKGLRRPRPGWLSLNRRLRVTDRGEVSPLVPEAGEWSDLPVSLDDLLPTNPSRDAGSREDAGAAPGPTAPPPSGPPLAAPPPVSAPPAPRREPTAADRLEIEQLHAEVTAASEASERSPFGTMGRKRLRTAQKAEAEALERLGFASHGDFVASTRAPRTRPPQSGMSSRRRPSRRGPAPSRPWPTSARGANPSRSPRRSTHPSLPTPKVSSPACRRSSNSFGPS